MSTTFQGRRGFVSLGGFINAYGGSPLVKGAVAQGGSSLTLDRNGSAIHGAVLPGDKFTVAGQAQQFTVVTGGVFAGSPNQLAITFTPTVPAGGLADNAVVTFVNNRLLEARDWSANADRVRIPRDVLGDKSKRYELGQLDWQGRTMAFFDYDDPLQAAVINNTTADNPTTVGLVLVVQTGSTSPDTKVLYGVGRVEQFRVESTREALIPVEFDFVGSSAEGLAIDWH